MFRPVEVDEHQRLSIFLLGSNDPCYFRDSCTVVTEAFEERKVK